MGTGKTACALAYCCMRKLRDGTSPSLVIAPTSVTHTWETEIARFTPQLRTLFAPRVRSDRAARYEEIAEATTWS